MGTGVFLVVHCLLLLPGSSLTTFPVTYRRHQNASAHEMHHKHHLRRGRRLQGDTHLYGELSLGYYYADIWLGSPPQRASVILDTGSGLTAIPCTGCRDCGAFAPC